MQREEAEAEDHEGGELVGPGEVERDESERRGHERAPEGHHPPLPQARDEQRHGARVAQPADAEPGDHEARDRGARLAGRAEQHGDIREQPEDEHAFEEHGREADFRPRIGEDDPITRRDGRKVEPCRPLAAGGAESDNRADGREQGEQAHTDEDAAPADDVADHSRQGGAEEIADHRRREQPSDGHLPLRDRHPVADHGHGDREDAAGDDAGQDAGGEHDGEGGRHGTNQAGGRQDHEAAGHEARLADHVGDRSEDRLGQGVGQREGRRQQGGGGGAHGEVGRHQRDHGIDGAQRQGGRERHEA